VSSRSHANHSSSVIGDLPQRFAQNSALPFSSDERSRVKFRGCILSASQRARFPARRVRCGETRRDGRKYTGSLLRGNRAGTASYWFPRGPHFLIVAYRTVRACERAGGDSLHGLHQLEMHCKGGGGYRAIHFRHGPTRDASCLPRTGRQRMASARRQFSPPRKALKSGGGVRR
jgi:hypothetical protein